MTNKTNPTDEEYEVVEEIVDDLAYFYEEEEFDVNTKKIRNHLRFRNIIIGVVSFLFLTFIVGYSQIAIYCLGNDSEVQVVTEEYKDKVVYLKQVEGIYSTITDFYAVNNDVPTGWLITTDISNIVKVNDLTTEINSVVAQQSTYLKQASSINNSFKNFNITLFYCLDDMNTILSYIANNSYMLPEDDSTFESYLSSFLDERSALMSAYNEIKKL